MATRTKYGTKEALESAKQSSRTAVAGGASMVSVGGKMMSKASFSKLMKKHSMAPDPRELSASKGLVKRYLPAGKVEHPEMEAMLKKLKQ